MKDHYIVCGYGRIGKVICQKLQREHTNLLVIEKNVDFVEGLEALKLTYICGDAGSEDVLTKAGIYRCKGLIAALGTDTDNVFLVLTARQLAPNLTIIARASSDAAKSKLAAAGADRVEAPYEIGAANMAQRILRPTVTNFLDLAFSGQHKDIQMEEMPMAEGSKFHELTLQESGIRQAYNLIIIAIKKADDQMIFNPSSEFRLTIGDTLVAVGEPTNLNRLRRELNPANRNAGMVM